MSPSKLLGSLFSAPATKPTAFSRRRFLALLGASAALATGAGCTRNRAAIVPYTKKQDEIVPGVANYYASSFPRR